MGITTAPGISFCWVGDDPIFLDLVRDRYLALSPDAGRALRRWVEGDAPADGDARHVRALTDRGLVIEKPGHGTLAPCRSLPAATTSLRDATGSATVPQRWSAMADTLGARAALHVAGLARTLARVSRRKASLNVVASQDEDEARRMGLARAFREADAALGALDLCVPRSVAMTLRAARLGSRCDLVIGVKLRPFAAHCWVQNDHTLLNEHIDVARPFTPILII